MKKLLLLIPFFLQEQSWGIKFEEATSLQDLYTNYVQNSQGQQDLTQLRKNIREQILSLISNYINESETGVAQKGSITFIDSNHRISVTDLEKIKEKFATCKNDDSIGFYVDIYTIGNEKELDFQIILRQTQSRNFIFKAEFPIE